MLVVDSKYRHIPAIHRLLDLPSMQIAIRDFGHAPVMEACRAAVDGLRQRVAAADVAEDAIGAPPIRR